MAGIADDEKKDPCRDSARAPLGAMFSDALPRMRRMGVGHAADGEDIVQDACMRLLARHQSVPIEHPLRYLFQVARNLLIDRRRAQARAGKWFDDGVDPEAVGADPLDPERILAGKQKLDVVIEAIEALPPRCREAFDLHRFEGLSYAVVARRMGISTSMVEKHIGAAMARLGRVALAADEGEPE